MQKWQPDTIIKAILGNRVLHDLFTTLLGIIVGIVGFLLDGFLGNILDCLIHIPGMMYVGGILGDTYSFLVGPFMDIGGMVCMVFGMPLAMLASVAVTLFQMPETVIGFILEFWDNTLALVMLIIRVPLSVLAVLVAMPTRVVGSVLGRNKTRMKKAE